MRCPNCGAEVGLEDVFCGECGFRLPQQGRKLALPVLIGVVVAVLVLGGLAYLIWLRPPSPEEVAQLAPTAPTEPSPTPTVVSPTPTPEPPGPTPIPPTPAPAPIDTPMPLPTPVERMIESFELYADNGELRAAYSINAPENDASVSLAAAPDVYHGSQALAFTYDIHTVVEAIDGAMTDYAGLTRDFTAQDWRGFNYLNLWVRGDGSNKDLVIQFHESSGEVWKYMTNLSGFRDRDLQLAFDANVFSLAEWSPTVNGQMDLGSIGGFSIYIGHRGMGQGTIYLDAFRLSE